MSIDDILFAPIEVATENVDFLVRRNRAYDSYDWKPVSSRAHDWFFRYFRGISEREMSINDGWVTHFYYTPNHDPNIRGESFNDELFEHGYTFKDVTDE